MIENILPICQNLQLVDLASDEDVLCDFLIPFISEHRRDYGTVLALGDIATIEFEYETVWLRSKRECIEPVGIHGIKHFTRRKIESAAWWISHTLCRGMHDSPCRPDIKIAFDYDC